MRLPVRGSAWRTTLRPRPFGAEPGKSAGLVERKWKTHPANDGYPGLSRPTRFGSTARNRGRRRAITGGSRDRQAGGHWFEPSTAHRKPLLAQGFSFLLVSAVSRSGPLGAGCRWRATGAHCASGAVEPPLRRRTLPPLAPALRRYVPPAPRASRSFSHVHQGRVRGLVADGAECGESRPRKHRLLDRHGVVLLEEAQEPPCGHA